jgi:hypothetical protein
LQARNTSSRVPKSDSVSRRLDESHLTVQSYEDEDVIDLSTGDHRGKAGDLDIQGNWDEESNYDDDDDVIQRSVEKQPAASTNPWQAAQAKPMPGTFAMTSLSASFESDRDANDAESTPPRDHAAAELVHQTPDRTHIASSTSTHSSTARDTPHTSVPTGPTTSVPILSRPQSDNSRPSEVSPTGRSEGAVTAATEDSGAATARAPDEMSETSSVDNNSGKPKQRKSIFGRISKSVMSVVRRSGSPSPTEKQMSGGNSNVIINTAASEARPRSGSEGSVNTEEGTVQEDASAPRNDAATADGKKPKSRWSKFKKSISGSMGIAYSSKPKSASPATGANTSLDASLHSSTHSAQEESDSWSPVRQPSPDPEKPRPHSIQAQPIAVRESPPTVTVNDTERAKSHSSQVSTATVESQPVRRPQEVTGPTTEVKIPLKEDNKEENVAGSADAGAAPPKQLASRPRVPLVRMNSDALVSQILTEFVEQGSHRAAVDDPLVGSDSLSHGHKDGMLSITVPEDTTAPVRKDGRGLANKLRHMLPNSGAPIPSWMTKTTAVSSSEQFIDEQTDENAASSATVQFDNAMRRLASRTAYEFQPFKSDYRYLLGDGQHAVITSKPQPLQDDKSKEIFGDFQSKALRTNKHFPVGHTLLGDDITEEDATFYREEQRQEAYQLGTWEYYADCLIPLSSTFIAREKRINETVTTRLDSLHKLTSNRELRFHHNIEIAPFAASTVFRKELSSPSAHRSDSSTTITSTRSDSYASRMMKELRPRGGMMLPEIYGKSYPVWKLSEFELCSGEYALL